MLTIGKKRGLIDIRVDALGLEVDRGTMRATQTMAETKTARKLITSDFATGSGTHNPDSSTRGLYILDQLGELSIYYNISQVRITQH